MLFRSTLYIEGERVFLIFSHSFEDVKKGDMCIAELSSDLLNIKSEITTLFSAEEALWAKPIPFAKVEFGMEGDVYFTDGPSVYKKKNGQLVILWSSWGENGYTVGQTVSESGNIQGPWTHVDKPVFERDGGHGMFFETIEGERQYTLHYPNRKGEEHPVFMKIEESEKGIVII